MGFLEGLGSLAGGIANMAGAAGDNGSATRDELVRIWNQLQTSNFDYRSLSAPQLQLLGQMEPQIYEAIVPPEARMVQDSELGRAGQVTGVQELSDIATGGMPLVDRLANERAARSVQDASRAANEDVLRSMAARGDLGAGDELQARIAANQGAQNMAGSMGAQMAQDAALRRLAATGQLGTAAGALRSGDVGVSAQNAGIANRFSEIFLQNQQQQARDAAAARERAMAYNLGRRQDVGDFNATSRYNTDLANLTRQNALRNTAFDQERSKLYGQSQVMSQQASGQDAEQRAKAAGLVGFGEGVGQTGDAILGYFANAKNRPDYTSGFAYGAGGGSGGSVF